MKKFFALILALCMVLSLCACGDKEEAGAAAGNATPGGNQSSGGNDAPTTNEPPANALATVNWGKAKAYIVGAELCYEDSVIRFYIDYTNLYEYPDSAYNAVQFIVTQNGEQLEELYSDEEDGGLFDCATLSVQPNCSNRGTVAFELLDDSKVTVELSDYNEEEQSVIFEVDPKALPGKPASEFALKGIADPKRTEDFPESGTYRDDFEITIGDMEVFTEGDDNIARIYYSFTNNGDEAESLYDICYMDVYQDGVELLFAYPENGVETDGNFEEEIEVGDTIEISICYLLRSDNPVEVEFYEFDDIVLGKEFPVK